MTVYAVALHHTSEQSSNTCSAICGINISKLLPFDEIEVILLVHCLNMFSILK
jgi:hypothetical protein